MKIHLRRMCGGAMRPWHYGWRKPRRAGGALIIDNLGIAVVYTDHEAWRP